MINSDRFDFLLPLRGEQLKYLFRFKYQHCICSKLPNGIRQNRVTHTAMPESNSETGRSDMHCQRRQQTSHTVSISYNYGSLSEYGSQLPMKEEEKIVFEYVPDPSKDMFQVGRVATNDFIVKGPLHYDHEMVTCGPVSRYACRIEVERKAPFRAFVYAAGFNADKVNHCVVLCFSSEHYLKYLYQTIQIF